MFHKDTLLLSQTKSSPPQSQLISCRYSSARIVSGQVNQYDISCCRQWYVHLFWELISSTLSMTTLRIELPRIHAWISGVLTTANRFRVCHKWAWWCLAMYTLGLRRRGGKCYTLPVLCRPLFVSSVFYRNTSVFFVLLPVSRMPA